MAKKIGVLLSGCGYLDGSEVQEATLTLYFLDKAGAEMIYMAPDKVQMHVVDHNAGAPVEGETRNIRLESARICSGNVLDVATVKADDFDALVIPGGFGVAKNLCTFAVDGTDCSVDPDVATLVKAVHSAGKPIGALCIAPALIAKLLGADHNVELTIGNDADTAGMLEAMGAKHTALDNHDIVVDEANKVVSTPCYMTAKGPAEVGEGAEKVDAQVMQWLGD
ncbi:isoprenoid biosynthesis glyoxalase ElbB [Endomicrobium sp. AH-315-J14]|nr:isoprenoid biosynthesis glyoxalase ElbB [Endomicrobium sp. AH-315-J14]